MQTTYTPTILPDDMTDEEFIELAEGLIVANVIASYDTATRSFDTGRSPEEQFDVMLIAIMGLASRIWDLTNEEPQTQKPDNAGRKATRLRKQQEEENAQPN